MTQKVKTIRSIHYLGSKLRLLNVIKDTVNSVATKEGAICDLFAGSGTVSKFMIEFSDVIAVDIQEYSKVICEASMSQIDSPPSIESVLMEIYNEPISKELEKCFCDLIEHERQCMDFALNDNIEPLYEIIEKGSLYIMEKGEVTSLSEALNEKMRESLKLLDASELLVPVDSMICRYYGGLYFSYEQAVMLDCISQWVFKQDGVLHTKALAALLSTASDIVNTVGKQFAQPLKVRNSKGELKSSLLKKILKDRTKTVWEVFGKWLKYYFDIEGSSHQYYVICDDYASALDQLKNQKISVVYADPPYTRYHYSRYYHVLETICLRDNPEVSTTFPNGKGGISRAIYRSDRHQSPFCIKTQAEHAFETLFEKVRALDVPLVLSYSPFEASKAVTPRLQTIDQLVKMAEQYFEKVTIVSPGKFVHSKLNSTINNFEASQEAELLIVCQ